MRCSRQKILFLQQITDVIDEQVVAMAVGSPVIQEKRGTTQNGDYTRYDYKTAREQFEKDYFSAILEKHDRNITSSAGAIGMAQSNLSRKLKELGLR